MVEQRVADEKDLAIWGLYFAVFRWDLAIRLLYLAILGIYFVITVFSHKKSLFSEENRLLCLCAAKNSELFAAQGRLFYSQHLSNVNSVVGIQTIPILNLLHGTSISHT